MNTTINQFINYGLQQHMISEYDIDYVVGLLLDLLQLDDFKREDVKDASIYDVLDVLLDEAVKKGIIEDDITSRDLFDTRIMNTLMPRPGEVIQEFNRLYKQSPRFATDYFYHLSIASNYIRKSRTDQNIRFTQPSKYGNINISINLSKPEKDPKEIAKAKLLPPKNYPKCLLCKENVGFAGDRHHPARQTHRLIPLSLSSGNYYLQYSPYVYYNEHCIVFNEHHVPMKISKQTFENLFSFIQQFPHYMIGSNADLPIVGGSILTHDHYQGGCDHFPMDDAKVLQTWHFDGYDVTGAMLYWPLSTLRLTSSSKDDLIKLSTELLEYWIHYSDESLNIMSHTGETRHNTITPISRMKDGLYQIDLVFRNNRCDEQYPDGIFHPHIKHHHIKKENIGLIEVMGLAILPARLKDELALLKECLLNHQNIDNFENLQKHKQWYQSLKQKDYTKDTIDDFLQKEVVNKFVLVLENAGVFKMNDEGQKGFIRFIESFKKRM